MEISRLSFFLFSFLCFEAFKSLSVLLFCGIDLHFFLFRREGFWWKCRTLTTVYGWVLWGVFFYQPCGDREVFRGFELFGFVSFVFLFFGGKLKGSTRAVILPSTDIGCAFACSNREGMEEEGEGV